MVLFTAPKELPVPDSLRREPIAFALFRLQEDALGANFPIADNPGTVSHSSLTQDANRGLLELALFYPKRIIFVVKNGKNRFTFTRVHELYYHPIDVAA